MNLADVWTAVQSGGDVAIYAILYYAHSINNRVNALEYKHTHLKKWVERIDDKVENLKGGERGK